MMDEIRRERLGMRTHTSELPRPAHQHPVMEDSCLQHSIQAFLAWRIVLTSLIRKRDQTTLSQILDCDRHYALLCPLSLATCHVWPLL